MKAEEISDLIRPIFPDGASLSVHPNGDDLVFLISWKLGGDPKRPKKRSRKIRLMISQEALEDYATASEAARSAAMIRLMKYVRDRYQEFEPDHDAPPHVPPPEDSWLATTQILGFG